MRAFTKVVEVGSFAEAARQTDTVKSVITKRVNQLEEYLELQLLQRSTRKLTLTDGGADFYRRSVELLAQMDEAVAAVSSVEWGLTGTLKVSCISSFAAKYLSVDLLEFQEEHPDLAVELQQHDRFCDPVQEGFDVCLQVSNEIGNALDKIDLLTIRRLIVATPRYLEQHGTPESVEDLTQHAYAHNNYVNAERLITFEAPKNLKPFKIDPQIATNTIWMIHAAVMSDRYIGLMPAFFIEEELRKGELVPILPRTRIKSPTLSAYYHRSSYVPMKVRILINFLRRKYGESPPWERRLAVECPDLSFALDQCPKAVTDC